METPSGTLVHDSQVVPLLEESASSFLAVGMEMLISSGGQMLLAAVPTSETY
jgi:hypothetical protein